MKVKVKIIFVAVVCVAFPVLGQGQSKFSCPGNFEDMLNYFVMAYPARVDSHMGPVNANPVYSSINPDYNTNTYAASGYFVWTKSVSGYPWDIKTFDSSYIYDRSTELGWTDPTSFKRFDHDLPMSPRCLYSTWGGPSVTVPASKTTYQTFSQCQPNARQPLGNVVNSVSAPTTVALPGIGPVKTRYFTYQYTCDPIYSSCKYKEVYSLGYGIGLYDWKYYTYQNNQYVLQAESIINTLQGGQTTPALTCTNSYQ